MNVEISHNLNVEHACLKLKKGINVLVGQYRDSVSNFESSWDELSGHLTCRIRGIKVSANLKVYPDRIVVQGKIPLAFLLFKNQIAETTKQTIKKILQ